MGHGSRAAEQQQEQQLSDGDDGDGKWQWQKVNKSLQIFAWVVQGARGGAGRRANGRGRRELVVEQAKGCSKTAS